MNDNLHDYALRIDGPLLADQRRLLLKVMDTVFRGEPYVAETPKDGELLQGIMALLDEIADQAHDRHGLDSLIEPEPDETEEPEIPARTTSTAVNANCRASSAPGCRASWPIWKTAACRKGPRSSGAASAAAIRPTRRLWKSSRN